MQRVHLIPGFFLVSLLTSCGTELSDPSQSKYAGWSESAAGSPTDKSANASGDSSNVIRLRNNKEIEFRGETVDGIREFATLLVEKVAEANQRVELSTELSIEVDDSSTVGFFRQVVFGLQSARFENLFLLSEGSKIRVPVAAAHSSESGLNLVTMKLVTSSSGSLSGIVVEGTGDFMGIESTDLPRLVEFTQNSLEKIITRPDERISNSSGQLDVELATPATLSARDYLMICRTITATVGTESGSSNSKIRFWPLGYPREAPLDLNLEQLIEPTNREQIQPPVPQPELKPLDIDGLPGNAVELDDPTKR